MKTIKNNKKFFPGFILATIVVAIMSPIMVSASSTSDTVIYPLKEVSKLDCRFQEFSNLSSDCKQPLPVLNTKDYKKYATQNWGYNDFTRLYTVLWWASYKYGWDVWNGWHIWVDIATSKWTPVYTIADWKVIQAREDVMEWLMISIEHNINWKYIVTNYLHLSKLNVKKWDTVKVWTKIWEVGSTWNSTWNHLHFQVDLDTPFHPYYYDYNSCPFSYYKITEDWVCFEELTQNTIDPLLFLESKWAVVNTISSSTYKTTTTKNKEDLSIFDRTVYIGYSSSDIKEVQEIFRKLWEYNWPISWDYKDIENSVIAYQIKNKLIANKDEYWAGRFGPKTRFQVKSDYLKLDDKTRNTTVTIITEAKPEVKVEKISRTNLMSREEIEKKEVQDFLDKYNIELDFSNQGSNIKKDSTEILKLKITDKKGKVFRWEMPWGMTFVVNSEKVNVFPSKLFYFTDWKRDIYLQWLNEWNTNLYVKIWEVTVKTIQLKIYDWSQTIYPNSASVLWSNTLTLWDKKTWIVLFKDENWKNMINLPYGSTFNIKASDYNKICIKKWSIKDIKTIYKADCDEEDYKNEHNFTYNDTVWWLLIYDFKATSKNFKITVKNNYDNNTFVDKKIVVTNPKWLTKAYAYTNDVLNMLEKWIVDWIKSWYFLENRDLTQRDAFQWTKNALLTMKENSYDNETNNKILNNISEIDKAIKYSSKTKTITRQEYLDITYKYLVFDENDYSKVEYRDIDDNTSSKLANIFDEQTTWKDQFGENYFRPDEIITRWEWAFFLSQSLNRIQKSYLTLN